jgi:hypothetical protein
MNTPSKSLVALTFAVVSALAPYSGPNAASNPLVEGAGLRGPLVNTGFSTTDPSGCVETDVYVSANSGTEQDHPGTTAYGVASVSIFRYDACTDTTLLQAVGLNDALRSEEFQVSKQLDWASLDTTITVTDIDTGNAFDVDVKVDLTGTSDLSRDHSNTNERYPGCHIINRWKGSGREAVAAGVVTNGVTDFTPNQSQSGEIGFVIDGFEVIGCP